MSEFKTIDKALRTAGRFYIDLLQEELQYQDHIASGRLAHSFKPKVSERGGNLYLEIVSDSSYMWAVNDGLPNGVKWSSYETGYSDILDWSKTKGFTFENKRHENLVISKIVGELSSKYLTEGGELVANRRYGFIEMSFAKADSMGLNQMIEEDILKQIDAVIGEAGQSKAIQLTIS
tara:strand:+ start:9551 stop:10081 length:531 start_codon:yes stop_codon:yes gene_type:complete